MTEDHGDFRDYKLMLLNELKRLEETSARLEEKIDALRVDVITLKVKASLVGAMSGTVASVVITIILKTIFK